MSHNTGPNFQTKNVLILLAVVLAAASLVAYISMNPGPKTPGKFYLSISEASCATNASSYYITVRNMDAVDNVSISKVTFEVDGTPIVPTWLQHPTSSDDDVISPKTASFVSIPCSSTGAAGEPSCVPGTTHELVISGPNRDKQVLVTC